MGRRQQQPRGYDYRKHQAEKVQKQRREIWNRRYYPTMCIKKVSKDGQVYFTEGSHDNLKQYLKKTMNRRFRKYGVDERYEVSGKSRIFRRAFNFDWIWY